MCMYTTCRVSCANTNVRSSLLRDIKNPELISIFLPLVRAVEISSLITTGKLQAMLARNAVCGLLIIPILAIEIAF